MLCDIFFLLDSKASCRVESSGAVAASALWGHSRMRYELMYLLGSTLRTLLLKLRLFVSVISFVKGVSVTERESRVQFIRVFIHILVALKSILSVSMLMLESSKL